MALGGNIDPSILLQARGITLPDPLTLAGQGLSLAHLASTNAMQNYQLRQAQRQDAAAQALGQLLPSLQRSGFSDQAVNDALNSPLVQQNPDTANAILQAVDARRKSDAEAKKLAAQAFRDTAEGKSKAMADISNAAFAEAQNPSPYSWQKVQSVARFWEVPLPAFVGDPNNPDHVATNLKNLGNAGLSVAEQIKTAETAKQHGLENDLNERKFQSEDAARKAATSQGWARINQESLGAPQEVTINGQPALAVFNRKGGGWFDPATGAKIDAQVTPKTPEMSSSMREKFAANNQMLSKIDNAVALVDERPQSFGGKFAGPDALNVRMDPQGVGPRAAVASIGSQKFHDLSGAAITISEAPRLQPFIPSVNDPPQAIKTKLQGLRRETAILQQELLNGRPTAEATSSAPVTTPPRPAPPILGASRAPGIRITPMD